MRLGDMILFKKPTFLTLTLLISAMTTLISVPVSACVLKPANALAVSFAQDNSDIKPDPEAYFGRLPNGMTYVIYKNGTPSGTVAIHLRIAGGSLMESDNERGLAHFIEHMAFNGSRNIPREQLLPLMERHGIKLGPDSGAITQPNKTEYIFNVPSNDSESIDTVLMIAREVAGNLMFEPNAVERERAVILGEERLRTTPQVLAHMDWLKAAFPGQKFSTHGNPIGIPQIIKSASPETLKGLYQALYRPDMATLVIVGDINPDRIESAIKTKFSDWRAEGPARVPDFGTYAPKGLKTYVYTTKALPNSLSVTWFAPFDPAAQTRRTLVDDVADIILVTTLNMRLQHLTQQSSTAFTGAAITIQPIYHTAKTMQFNIMPKSGQDKAALTQALTALQQFRVGGIVEGEMAPVFAQLDSFFRQQVAGGKTRDNEAIAANIINSLDTNSVFTSPKQDLAEYERLAQTLTQDTLNTRIKNLFKGDGPLLSHTGEDLSGVAAPTMEAIFASSSEMSGQGFTTDAAAVWPYTNFGTPKTPVSKQDFPQNGFVRYTFSNGLKLNLKPTKFKDDQVLVSVNFKGGIKSFSPQTHDPIELAKMYAGMGGFFKGGLGKLDFEQVQKSLAGKSFSLTYNIGEDATALTGVTTRSDVGTQLQVLMAYITDPAYRPAVFTQIHATLPAIFTQLNGSAQGVLQSNFATFAHSNDKRFVFPSETEANAITFDQVKSVIQASISGKPIEITVVGDIDTAATLDDISRTFATLPLMPEKPALALDGGATSFPVKTQNVVLTHKGRVDQSASLLAWPVPGELHDTQTSRGLEILTEILNQRVFDTLRQKLGQAYDVNASRQQSWAFNDFGFISVSGSIAINGDKTFVGAVNSLLEDLKSRPVSQDELDRARQPLLEHWQIEQTNNQHWIYAIPPIANGQAGPQGDAKTRAELLKVTPDMLLRLARTYFVPNRVLHIQALPSNSAVKNQ